MNFQDMKAKKFQYSCIGQIKNVVQLISIIYISYNTSICYHVTIKIGNINISKQYDLVEIQSLIEEEKINIKI